MKLDRKIIKTNLEKAVEKKAKAKTKEEVRYWEWVTGQLIDDLRALETDDESQWRREPLDEAWKRYRRVISWEDVLRRFFGEGFPF